jgi:hypothetical protein
MKYEEAERRLKKLSYDSKLLLTRGSTAYVSPRDTEAIDTILADVETWRATCSDAASTLIVVGAQRDMYQDVLRKVRKLATSDDVPVAVLAEIINLVSNLNFSDAAQPQKEPS